jgi:histone acetyltransferase 1
VDTNWFYFLVYLDNKLVAYATTFDEFLKVPKAPLTISQVLVMPPYQKFGIGSTLLDIIYNNYLRVQKCLTMIVEDPAEDFQRMKDGLDIKLILKSGYFRCLKGLGLHNPTTYLTQEQFKVCGLDHREVNEIRTKLKLKKENILRCFELLQIACLDPEDTDLHEAYRKYVLRKFTESRDLLLPYFKFEHFADRSMFTINQQVRADCRVVEKCCLGNG